MKKLLIYTSILTAALFLSNNLLAQEIRDVSTKVFLYKDGSALVEQTWDVTIVNGTEWYIPISNLGKMYISDFQVFEDGREFVNDGRSWDSGRSRSEKTGRCGIIEKGGNDVELCWGQGDYGDHIWTCKYRISDLVQSLEDYDAFNHQFVNPELISPPLHSKLIIINETGGEEWTSEKVKVWAFGFIGEINVEDGQIVAETSEPMIRRSSIIAMIRFDKGIFSPEVSRDMFFEEMQERAFEGSSYLDSESESNGDAWIGLLLLFGLPVAYSIFVTVRNMLGYKYKKSMFGVSKITGWYREPPFGGNIPAAWYVLHNGLRSGAKIPPACLIGAYFLRWILEGRVIVKKDSAKSKNIALYFKGYPDEIDSQTERELYNMAMSASGDNILESSEFKTWSRRHYKKMLAWPEKVADEGMVYIYGQVKSNITEKKINVAEFNNFLKDFTLSSQRDVVEVGLWKDYLVYAQLYGIASRVAKDFQKLYPEIMQECAETIGMSGRDLMTLVNINQSMTMNAFLGAQFKSDAEKRSSGSGGYSSFGGGGGFSGGGSGGGSR